MHVINAENVNDAMAKGIDLILDQGVQVESRNGMTLEVPEPVATVYKNPYQRVLISYARDANPFFHLMESLWILAGRQDVKFLNEFNKRMVDFSDDGKVFNAPYGYRLRERFDDSGKCDFDQVAEVIAMLNRDPNSRRAVCQIWDTEDLNKDTKDKACNMSVVFRIRDSRLDMTVYNRSNDMIWGAYGANAVQFSMLQEYVAAHLDIEMGTYTQVSNSFHVYTEGPGGKVFRNLLEGFQHDINPYDYVNNTIIMAHEDMGNFESDLSQFFNIYDYYGLDEVGLTNYWESDYFKYLVNPMLSVYLMHKNLGPVEASNFTGWILADDWRIAANGWLTTRIENRAAK